MGFWDGSGIRWTIRKQSAPRSRQITTSTRHHSSFTAGCSSWRPTSSVKALKAKDVNRKPVGKRLCLDACMNADTFTHVHTDRQHKNIMLVLGGYGIITPVNMAFAGNVNSVAQLFKCCIFCINFSQLSQEMMGVGMQWHQLDHMQTICTCSRQTTTPTPHHLIFTGRMLLDAQPTVSKHRRP